MNRPIAVALLALSLTLGVSACGGGDGEGSDTTSGDTTLTETTTEETTTDGTSVAAGKEVFLSRCGSCHTLADAGTSGAVGPNLDAVSPSVDTVRTQVREGGGQMPAFEGDLSDAEIDAVAEYVSEAAQG